MGENGTERARERQSVCLCMCERKRRGERERERQNVDNKKCDKWIRDDFIRNILASNI